MKQMRLVWLFLTFFLLGTIVFLNAEKASSKEKVEKENTFTTRSSPTLDVSKIKKEEIDGTFETLRMFDSNVHVYLSGSEETLLITMGEKGLEKLGDIKIKNSTAKLNAGMFNPAGAEHGGLFFLNGSYQSAPSSRYISAILLKNGKLDIHNYSKEFTEKDIEKLKEEAVLGIGTTYSLVQDGKENLENASVFTHSNQKQPRSLFGQTKDGRFLFVAVDGRQKESLGVTAKESAQIMLSLKAVEAVNLDGGGSTSLHVENKLVNKPSEGKERPIGSALFLVK